MALERSQVEGVGNLLGLVEGGQLAGAGVRLVDPWGAGRVMLVGVVAVVERTVWVTGFSLLHVEAMERRVLPDRRHNPVNIKNNITSEIYFQYLLYIHQEVISGIV